MRCLVVLVAVLSLGVGAAQAVPQFTPSPGDSLHTIFSGEAGAQWNTSGVGVGGSISYSSGTQQLSITAVLDILNYFNPGNGSCPTDAGSNCAFNYGPDLDITLLADLHSVVVTDHQRVLPGAGQLPDDGGVDLPSPTRPMAPVQLEANWQGGPSRQSHDGYGRELPRRHPQRRGHDPGWSGLAADGGTPYASLFVPTYLVAFQSLSDFVPTLDSLADDLVEECRASPLTLESFTAEANGRSQDRHAVSCRSPARRSSPVSASSAWPPGCGAPSGKGSRNEAIFRKRRSGNAHCRGEMKTRRRAALGALAWEPPSWRSSIGR
jgi:hypothetical protein